MIRINDWIKTTLANAGNSIGKFLMVTPEGNSRRFNMEEDEFYTVHKPHGFFAFDDEELTITVNNAGEWYQVTNGTNNLFSLVESGAGFLMENDRFIFDADPIPGYTAHIKFDFKIQGLGHNNINWELEMYNVTQDRPVRIRARDRSEGTMGIMSLVGIGYDLEAHFGDLYIMQIRNTTNTQNFIANSGAIFVEVSHLKKIT